MNYSIKVSLTISYLLIFGISLISSLFVYIYNNNIFKENLISSGEMFLNNIISQTNSTLNEAILLTKIIEELPETKEVLKLEAPLTPEKETTINNLYKQIKAISQSYGFADQPCIYLSKFEKVISTAGITSFGEYYNNSKKDLKNTTSLLSWRSFLISSPGRKLTQGNNNVVFYSKTFGTTSNSNPYYPMCIVIKTLFLQDETPMFNGYNYVVLDEYDTPVLYSSTIYKRKIFKNFNPETDSYVTINNTRYLVKYKKDTSSNYTYISAIPYDHLTKTAKQLGAINIIIILISIIIFLILTVYSLKQNYTPLKNAVNTLKKHINPANSAPNEIKFLIDAMDKLLKENSEISSKLDKQSDILKMHGITSLLKNRNSKIDDSIINNMKQNNGSIVISAVYIEDYGEYFTSADLTHDSITNDTLVYFAIKQVFQELLEKIGSAVYHTETEGLSVFIIILKNENSDYLTALKKARDFLEENLKVLLTVSVSNIGHSTDEIPSLYLECLDLLDYRATSGKCTVIQKNITDENSVSYTFSYEEEGLLKNYLLQGNSEKASELVFKIINNSMHTTSNPDILKYVTFDIVSTILKTCDICSKVPEYISELHKFLKWTDLTYAKAWISKLIKEVCALYNHHKSNDIVSEAIEFVKNNYQNNDLSVSMVASYLDITPSYLSNIFRREKEEKLLDYINKYRIEKSKELLKENKLLITEVSEAVGYTNPKTFRRLFKKYTNILPTDFIK